MAREKEQQRAFLSSRLFGSHAQATVSFICASPVNTITSW